MFLKRIELKGFKSFADKTVIDFGDGITCIVGPNGSGKSNITDAFRWVLGEQRYKTLRGKQMSDVIFSGTNQRKALGFAEVSIIFDNESQFLPIDFGEVVVTRRLYRSGESVYSINDAECRLKDVKQLFMDTGVGVEGYSIIGQGRIDSILSTNKDERRLIFEEAAGIVKYRTRKDEAERKLSRVNNNLERISDIVDELELRIEPLRIQAEKAKQYKDYAAQLRALEVNIFVHDIEEANRQIELLKADITARRQQLTDDETQLESQLKKLTNFDQTIERAENDYENDLATIGQLKADIARLVGEVAVLQERASALANNKTAKQTLLKNNRAELLELTDQLAATETDLATQNQQYQNLQLQMQNASSQLADLTARRGQLIDQQRQKQMTIDQLADSINHLLQDNHRLAARDEIAEQRLSAIDQDIISFQAAIEQEQAQSAGYQADITQLKDNLTTVLAEKAAVNQEIERIGTTIDSAENELYHLRSSLAEDETALAALQLQEAQHEGFSYAVKQVLNWSKKDDMVYGSVKDLFSVDKKFFTAMETALGKHLQSIVVADEDVVDSYIERLKAEKAGRATFIPLAQVKPRELPKRESSAGYYGCAWYLIDCKPELANAFKFLLSGIFFSDTLSDAKRIAKKLPKGARVISLAGEVVHVGGTITGGSLSKRDSGFLARKNDIKNLQQKISDNRRQHAERAQFRQAQIDSLAEQRTKLAQYDAKITAYNDEINSLQQSSAAAQQRAGQVTQQHTQISDEANALRAAKQERATQLADNEAALAAKQLDLATAQRDLEQLLEKIEQQVQTLTECETHLTDCKVDLAKAEQVVKSVSLKHTQLSERQTALQHAIDSLTTDLASYDETAATITGSIKAADKQRESAELKLTDLSDKTTATKTAIEANRQAQVALQQEVESARLALQDKKNDIFKIELDLTRIETRRESIIQNLWDTYELSYIKALDYKQDVDIKAYAAEARRLKRQIKQLGDVNLGAIAEYDTVNERYQFLSEQQNDLLQASEKLTTLIRQIDRQMRKTFKDKLNEVNGYFGEVFSKLFGGGSGQIVLAEADDVLDAEIMIQAQPPGKKLQSLELLSGGEKALTAISLLFAILKTKPTPFCILDEIEAALDDVNIYRFADFLKEFVGKAQFIIITHRKGTMEIAEYLYGVTMRERGITTMLSVELTDAQQLLDN